MQTQQHMKDLQASTGLGGLISLGRMHNGVLTGLHVHKVPFLCAAIQIYWQTSTEGDKINKGKEGGIPSTHTGHTYTSTDK